ncbi:MAG: chromate resistance protein [Gammaproteobacteria bacterium]|nr:chromate resistance protein [Gammaproteobacteria bacterium]
MQYAQGVSWLLFIGSLPGQSGTPRIRLWRALKRLGAAVVRDGVYLLPARDSLRASLENQAREVQTLGGTAFVLEVQAGTAVEEQAFRALFDRRRDYAALMKLTAQLRANLPAWTEPQARRALRPLRRELEALTAIDFFPGAAKQQMEQALDDAEAAIQRRHSPDEPTGAESNIPRLKLADFQARSWATRQRLWVDRVASAWLIRRFIDREARFSWLRHPRECPPDALGFDFDGAAFTHVGSRVSFEVLLASFGLEADPALARIGALVHVLDVGGTPPPEAQGFEAILIGARERCADDDQLLVEMSLVLDCLYAAFRPQPLDR